MSVIAWEPMRPGWIGHGADNDYLLSFDAGVQWKLTRWQRTRPEPAAAAGFAREVPENTVPVPGTQAGRVVAQAHEDAMFPAGQGRTQGAWYVTTVLRETPPHPLPGPYRRA